jgi:HD-like signal output (HDOD) protein
MRPVAEMLHVTPPPVRQLSSVVIAERLIPLVVSELTVDRDQLPAIPAYAMALLDLTRRIEHAEASEIVSTIARDPDTVGRVLQVASSAIYRGLVPITSLRQALVRLGRREVSSIASVVSMRFLFNIQARRIHDVLPRQWYEEQQHAVATALATSALARALAIDDPDDAFSYGLFVDIGRSFVLRSVCSLMLAGKIPRDLDRDSLTHLLDMLHTAVGESVLTMWQVPQSIIEISASHHDDEPPHKRHRIHHALRLVAGVGMLRSGVGALERTNKEVEDSAAFLRIDPTKLHHVGVVVDAMRAKAAQLLGPRPVERAAVAPVPRPPPRPLVPSMARPASAPAVRAGVKPAAKPPVTGRRR